MEELVILRVPSVLLLCAAALFLCLFDRRSRASRGWLSVLSAALALTAAALDLLNGADLREAAAIAMVFLLLQMGEGK